MRRTFHDMSDHPPPGAAPGKPLKPAARRALEEAAARRAAEPPPDKTPKEIGGAAGPDPSRFGDWEHKGRAIDF
ncbi:MAG TPA: DUF1674 domain-containing protein [Caulobacteraceae bacterium]|jgi:hypothetical protein